MDLGPTKPEDLELLLNLLAIANSEKTSPKVMKLVITQKYHQMMVIIHFQKKEFNQKDLLWGLAGCSLLEEWLQKDLAFIVEEQDLRWMLMHHLQREMESIMTEFQITQLKVAIMIMFQRDQPMVVLTW